MTGLVSLVGAGPGDPELLTLRAVRRLAAADLVLYDALVDPAMLDLAPQARRFHVGKRAGRPSIAQDTIHRLMIRAARRGDHVVRLKCGDPFVFGRGGEEVLALAAAGIRCEVIPGVTTAIAAPSLAGIPVTHRGIASAFVVVAGHAAAAFEPVLSSLAPGGATVVALMGLANRAAIARVLMERGWPAATPAAIVCDASGESQQTWRGVLQRIGDAALADHSAPGTIVVGHAVTALHAAAMVESRTEERVHVSHG